MKKQFTLFTKTFNIPPKVLLGILITLPVLLGTSVALRLVSQSSDDRSQALSVNYCGWCGSNCQMMNAGTQCPQVMPPAGCTCQTTTDGSGCEAVCNDGVTPPVATHTPLPPPGTKPTYTPPVATHTPLPPPPGTEPTATITPDPAQQSCLAAGGTWATFPNSCADTCYYAENPGAMCLQVVTRSCNCGPNKCWDSANNLCLDDPGPPIPPPSPTITPEPSATPQPTAIPDPTEPPQGSCPQADIASMAYPNGYDSEEAVANKDCCVNQYDLDFLKSWLLITNDLADINQDSKINLWDYAILVSEWNQGCSPLGEPL